MSSRVVGRRTLAAWAFCLVHGLCACDPSASTDPERDTQVASDGSTADGSVEPERDTGAEVDGSVGTDAFVETHAMSDAAASTDDAAAAWNDESTDAADDQPDPGDADADAPTAIMEASVDAGSEARLVTFESLRLSIPEGALTTATQIAVRVSTGAAPSALRPQSPVYEFVPAVPLLAPARIAFETASTSGTIYWWSEATQSYVALASTYANGQIEAHVGELTRGFVALGLPACASDERNCAGVCVDVETNRTHCGGCGEACARGESCAQGECVESVGESCSNPIVVTPEVDDAYPTLSNLRGDLRQAAPHVRVPGPLSFWLGTGSSHEPVPDLVWAWTPTHTAPMQASAPWLDTPFVIAVYKGGCAPEQLVAAKERESATSLTFMAEAGVTYYFVAFKRPWLTTQTTTNIDFSFDTDSDPSLPPCPSGYQECSGICRYVVTSPTDCGSCGHACGAGAGCLNGQCVCGVGGTRCGDDCADLRVDPLHCGACGNACARDSLCVDGSCRPAGAGLSCASAIEIGSAPDQYPRFSMQGAEAPDAWQQMCTATGRSKRARIFKLTAAGAGGRGLGLNSEHFRRAAIAELDPASCEPSAPLLECAQVESNYTRAGVSLGYSAGDVRYVLVTDPYDTAQADTLQFVDLLPYEGCRRGTYRCAGECVVLGADERNCGTCGKICASGRTCIDGVCRVPPVPNCAEATPLAVTVNDHSVAGATSEHITQAAADLILPPLVAHYVGRGSSDRPVSDRIWSWTPDRRYQAEAWGKAGESAAGVPTLGALSVYQDGCEPEQLVGAQRSGAGSVSFRAVAGSTYYFVASRGPGRSPSATDWDAELHLYGYPNANYENRPEGPCPGQECNGACVDLSTSVAHCGRCSNSCGGGASCVNGVCTCTASENPGKTLCDSTCVDLKSDPLHCGGCYQACGAESLCVSGSCQAAGAGLSCATAIELDPAALPQFSLQGPLSQQSWPQTCGGPKAAPHARIFKYSASAAGARRIGALSEAQGFVTLSELTEGQCQGGGPALECSLEAPYATPAAVDLQYAANDVRYLLVSSTSDDQPAGKVVLSSLPGGPSVPTPSPVCLGQWGATQRAADAQLAYVAPTSSYPNSSRLIDANNNALELAVSGESFLTDGRIVARHYTPETGWSQPVELGSAYIPSNGLGNYAPELQLVGDPMGTAFAVWRLSADGSYVAGARYIHGHGWDAIQGLGSDGGRVPGGLGLRITPRGGANVTYSGSEASWITRYLPGEGWQPKVELPFLTSAISVGENATGQAMLLYRVPSLGTYMSFWSQAAHAFGTPTLLPADIGAGGSLVVDSVGAALQVIPTFDRGPLYTTYRDGAWSAPAQIRPVDQRVNELQLYPVGDEAVIALWRFYNLFASCYTPGYGWTPAHVVSELAAEQLRFVPNGPRGVLARWEYNDEYVARYDW